MYMRFFGLKQEPFSLAPDPRYLYMSEQHREALAHLVYGLNSDGGFVLLTGEASVVKFADGEQVCLARLGPGDCFGEMALVNTQARSATVRAESDALSLRFSKEKIDAYPEAAAFIYRNIAKILARRLSDSNEVTAKLMLELTSPEVDNHAPSDVGNRHTEFEG